MKTIIKGARLALGFSQMELAEKLSVTFATVNRWENGRATPNRIAQERLYELCEESGVSILPLIRKKISTAVSDLRIPEGRTVLYHGSKSGLQGKIVPVSRGRCDFGSGFYMGDRADQPLTLVCGRDQPKFYVMSIDLRDLRVLKVPTGLDWAFLVAYNRGAMDRIKGESIYNKYRDMASGFDVVVGSIADDRMFVTLDSFFSGSVTDEAMLHSLMALKLGMQYVCVSQKACDAVRVEREIGLSYLELKALRKISADNRQRGIELAKAAALDYRRSGRYFDEILRDGF